MTNRPYKDIIWAFDIVIIEKDRIGTARPQETRWANYGAGPRWGVFGNDRVACDSDFFDADFHSLLYAGVHHSDRQHGRHPQRRTF